MLIVNSYHFYNVGRVWILWWSIQRWWQFTFNVIPKAPKSFLPIGHIFKSLFAFYIYCGMTYLVRGYILHLVLLCPLPNYNQSRQTKFKQSRSNPTCNFETSTLNQFNFVWHTCGSNELCISKVNSERMDSEEYLLYWAILIFLKPHLKVYLLINQ